MKNRLIVILVTVFLIGCRDAKEGIEVTGVWIIAKLDVEPNEEVSGNYVVGVQSLAGKVEIEFYEDGRYELYNEYAEKLIGGKWEVKDNYLIKTPDITGQKDTSLVKSYGDQEIVLEENWHHNSKVMLLLKKVKERRLTPSNQSQ